ncbi:hypothetical protein LF1_16860 [Rubripirellula obstinata]|uniref:Uncharacterized protein n=1 Tax=Rubripirellula obstinata TaxID=406547 RepID=A0A5B1CDC3_9BACT|nr:hypothetical protein [Rubripirellula obstinata]KAA1259158.1 hypothetical protein LF1_16860 [Rubripirellula obstinata]
MPNDLEDFLRRAAQRRQAKAADQKQAQQPVRPVRPQYSNSRTERLARPVEEPDPVLMAEIVDEDAESHSRQIQRLEDQRRSIEEAKKVARRLEEETAKKQKKSAQKDSSESSIPQSTGHPIADLLANFRRPGGIQQAILMREILDRPEHRWPD